MSRARHIARKDGGSVKETEYNAQGSNAMREAKEKKRGGAVKGEGEKPKAHFGKKGRARGGRIGSNLAPLSTAARIKMVTKGEIGEDAEKSD
jgi:hypothetical protein